MVSIFVSLAAGNMLCLHDQIKLLDPYCDGYHLDFMDGQFVPTIVWGPEIINQIAAVTHKKIWVHIMALNPIPWILALKIPPNSLVTFHKKPALAHEPIVSAIKNKGWHAGIALSPQTPINSIDALLPSIDHILVMSVNPGSSGQISIQDSIAKIKALDQVRKKKSYSYAIGADGGINSTNLQVVIRSGVSMVAIGSGIFSSHKAPYDAVAALRELAKSC